MITQSDNEIPAARMNRGDPRPQGSIRIIIILHRVLINMFLKGSRIASRFYSVLEEIFCGEERGDFSAGERAKIAPNPQNVLIRRLIEEVQPSLGQRRFTLQ